MKAYIISDGDYKTAIYEKLSEQVDEFFSNRGFQIEKKNIQKGDLHFCIGCYGCWTKKPGECVINDSMTQINLTLNCSDVVVYLSPIVFGQYSPNIKNAIDRWLPNLLPLFVMKPDGTTGHPPRYQSKPQMVVIGYGNMVPTEEEILFKEVVRHRTGVEVFVFVENQRNISHDLEHVSLERVRG